MEEKSSALIEHLVPHGDWRGALFDRKKLVKVTVITVQDRVRGTYYDKSIEIKVTASGEFEVVQVIEICDKKEPAVLLECIDLEETDAQGGTSTKSVKIKKEWVKVDTKNYSLYNTVRVSIRFVFLSFT